MRFPISNAQSSTIVNAEGKIVGVLLMNASGVDVYVSENQRDLDTVDASDLPSVGALFPGNQEVPVIIPSFTGKLFARAVNVAQIEVIVWPVSFPQC